MFTLKTHVRMRDTDAAGVIYFACQPQIAHEVFEMYLDTVGLGVRHMLEKTDYRLPIVHIESDYRAPLKVGDELTIHMTTEQIRTSSFKLRFRLFNQQGLEAGWVRTVHVAVDAGTWKKRDLPQEMREVLAAHLESN